MAACPTHNSPDRTHPSACKHRLLGLTPSVISNSDSVGDLDPESVLSFSLLFFLLSHSFILSLIQHNCSECLLCARHLDNSGLRASIAITLSNIKISRLQIEQNLEILGSDFKYHFPPTSIPHLAPCKCFCSQMRDTDHISQKGSLNLNQPSLSHCLRS